MTNRILWGDLYEDDRCEFDGETLFLLSEFNTDEDLDRDIMVRVEDYCHEECELSLVCDSLTGMYCYE